MIRSADPILDLCKPCRLSCCNVPKYILETNPNRSYVHLQSILLRTLRYSTLVILDIFRLHGASQQV